MPLERLKSTLDRDGPRRQRVDEGSVDTPDEIQDPTTFRDQATPTFRERLAENKLRLLGKSFLILASLIVFLHLSTEYFPELYTSPITRRGFVIALIVGGTFVMSVRWLLGRLESMDWLVLVYPTSIVVYLGEYETSDGGKARFLPYRGFSFLGGRSHHYELAELSEQLAQSAAKSGRKPSDPVRIGVPEGILRLQTTWFGTVGGAVTDSLVPIKSSESIDLLAVGSSRDHEDVMESLLERYKKQQRRIHELEDELATVREERDKYRREAKDTRKEVREEERDHLSELLAAIRNPSSLDSEQNGTPSMNGSGNPSAGSGNGLPPEIKEELDTDA